VGVRLLTGEYDGGPSNQSTVLVDSVTGFAFGPVFDSPDDAEEFVEHVRTKDGRDPRTVPDGELERLHVEWVKGREVEE
jgi:hypothetical protein